MTAPALALDLDALVARVAHRCRTDEPEPGPPLDRPAPSVPATLAHVFGVGVEVGQARALRILLDEVARLVPIAEPSA